MSKTWRAWTDEQSSLLMQLWKDGYSAREIANRIGAGVTRSAVIGRAHRLGMSKLDQPQTKEPKAAPVRPKRTRRFVRPRPFDDVEAPAVAHTAVQLVPLVELTSDQCRWPVGDPGTPGFGFCGEKKYSDFLPYCLAHCRAAYREPGK